MNMTSAAAHRVGHPYYHSSPLPSPAPSPSPSRSASPPTLLALAGPSPSTTLLHSPSPLVPSIILTLPPPSDSAADSDYISQLHRRRMRRPRPPSPHLLWIGWRRRADSFPDPYGLISDGSATRPTQCYSHGHGLFEDDEPSLLARAVVLAAAKVAALNWAGLAQNARATLSAAALDLRQSASLPTVPAAALISWWAPPAYHATDKHSPSLPMYSSSSSTIRSNRHARRKLGGTHPVLALLGLLFALAIGLTLALRGSLLALDSPLAYAAKGHAAYGYAHPATALAAGSNYGPHHQAAHVYPAPHGSKHVHAYTQAAATPVADEVGITFPDATSAGSPGRGVYETERIVDAFAGVGIADE